MGTNFCTSAWNAFRLIFANVFTVGFVTVLSAVIYTIGWVFIMIGTATVGYFIVRGIYPDVSFVAPVILYVAMGYLVGKLLMNIFTLAVDTSLQCMVAAREMDMTSEMKEFVPGPMQSRIKFDKKKEDES